MVASNQPDAINYQTLEQLEEETSTDPIVQPHRNQSQESNPTSPSSPGKKFPHPIEKVANAIKNKTYDESDTEIKETVIRVPTALSQQALEMALKSGMHCFRVEVI